jgi:hypothetical protein
MIFRDKDEHRLYARKRHKDQRPNGTQLNTDKHRFHFQRKIKEKRSNGTRMNTDTHGSMLKRKEKRKDSPIAQQKPGPEGFFFRPGNARNPPLPPFSKGGQGGISERRVPPKYA